MDSFECIMDEDVGMRYVQQKESNEWWWWWYGDWWLLIIDGYHGYLAGKSHIITPPPPPPRKKRKCEWGECSNAVKRSTSTCTLPKVYLWGAIGMRWIAFNNAWSPLSSPTLPVVAVHNIQILNRTFVTKRSGYFFSRKTGWSLSPTHVVPCVSQKVATKKNKQSAQWVKWCFCFSSLDPKMWITNRLTNATSSYLWCACCSMFSYVPLHSKDRFCHTKKHAQNNHGDHVILFTDPYLKFAFKEVTRRCVSLWFGSEDIFEEMCQSVLQKAVTSNLGPHLFPYSSSAWLKLWINLINQLNQPLPSHVSDLWNMGLIRPDWGKPGTLRGGLGWPAICFCFLFFIFLALVFEKTFESTKGLCMYFLAPLWRVDDLLFSVHG